MTRRDGVRSASVGGYCRVKIFLSIAALEAYALCAAEDAEVFGPVRIARRSCSDCALEGCHRIVQIFPAAGLLKSGLQDEAEVEQYRWTGWVIRLSLGQSTAKHVDAFIQGGTKFLQ